MEDRIFFPHLIASIFIVLSNLWILLRSLEVVILNKKGWEMLLLPLVQKPVGMTLK